MSIRSYMGRNWRKRVPAADTATDTSPSHPKNRTCERTDEVLENYRHRAMVAEARLVEFQRWARQAEADEMNGVNIAWSDVPAASTATPDTGQCQHGRPAGFCAHPECAVDTEDGE